MYIPVFDRKPGALRNGAPFNDWGYPLLWQCSYSPPKGGCFVTPRGSRC